MTYRGHLRGGAVSAVGSAAVAGLGLEAFVALLAASLLGSLAPDLDEPKSKIGRWTGMWLVRPLYSNPLTWKLAGSKQKLLSYLGHRRLTHSLVGALVASLVIWGLTLLVGLSAGWIAGGSLRAILKAAILVWPVPAGFAVGYLSHLLLDTLTGNGVPLFLPFSTRKVVLLPKAFRRMLS